MDYARFWKALIAILNKHWQPKGRHKSHATCYEVPRRIRKGFEIILDLGYKIPHPKSLKRKHVRAMAMHLEQTGKSPSTIANMISAMRKFSAVIGKPYLVQDSRNYVTDPKSVYRPRATDRDKTWSGAGVDIMEKMAGTATSDPYVAIQLELCFAFGLRVKEAWILQPAVADMGSFLDLSRGTKGGRPRAVPIENERQRQLLDRAKTMANHRTGSMVPEQYSLKQWKSRFYKVCAKHGISRENGCVPHGLRHEYANDTWEKLTGIPSQIKGGDITMLDPEVESRARITVAENLGHSREEITTAYYGPKRPRRKSA